MTGSFVRLARCAGAAVLLLGAPAQALAAQGVTSAALIGTVTNDQGAPLALATVELLNTKNGQKYTTKSSQDGRYFFENLQVGGPYTLDVKALGHEPARESDIYLRLGQRLERNFTLRQVAFEVNAVVVTAEANPLINQARTGAQGYVSEKDLARMPTLGRNFTDFIVTVPQVVTTGVPGTTIGGQNNRFNNIQIDGGVNNDLFGLAASGTPGGQANAHPISVDAVKEYNVLVAPFDVRQAGFTGGLVNAVTKSGTNEFHGSLFGYLQTDGMTGNSPPTAQYPDGQPQAEFHQSQLGGTFGGPLIKDRLHIFAAVDIQDRAAPFVGEEIGTNGISEALANRVRQIMINDTRYGFDPGVPDAPTQLNPDKNIFAKLSLQVGSNATLEVSHNYVDAANDNLIRNAAATGFRDGYQLSNSGYNFATITNTTRAIFNSRPFASGTNELILSRQIIRDERDLPNRVPLIFVQGEQSGRNLAAGADRFSHQNFLDQDIYEITDNLSFSKGKHFLTVGTHNEFFGFVNGFFPASLGVWNFADTTALIAGTPNRYEIAVPRRPGGPTADFNVTQLGFYVQDRWSPTARLTLTGGLRLDVPNMPAPTANPSVALVDTLGVNTGAFPTSNALWSPRVGFNYDAAGDGRTFLRGGVGVFSGRPPYVWLSNAYGNTGMEQATLICDNGAAGYLDTVPVFTVDPDNQPQQCRGGAVTAAAAVPSIVYFDENFKFPQNLKVAFGADQQLPWGMVATVDFLYTKSLNQFYITDVNLRGVQNYSTGEAGRALYGTLSATSGTATPTRITAAARDVLRHRNESEDRSVSFTGQLQKRFGSGLEFNVGYTYSRTEDLYSLTSSVASSNFRFTALDGTLENRNLRTSGFDIPHKFTLSGTVAAPLGIFVSLIYIQQSGHPYGFMVQDDANADGQGGNDLVYVPRDRADMSVDGNMGTAGLGTLAQQDSVYNIINGFINGSDCLRAHRGSVLPRNSCRTDPINFLNMRLTKDVGFLRGHRVEFTLDAFNVLYMINNEWSVVKEYGAFEEVNFLRRFGYDAVYQRGIYGLNQQAGSTNPLLPVMQRNARWRLQLSARYAF